MTYTFDLPKKTVIVFSKKAKRKISLTIPRCISFKTGKTIIIDYIAKDEKIHRHKYPNSHILFITSEGEVMYEAKRSTF